MFHQNIRIYVWFGVLAHRTTRGLLSLVHVRKQDNTNLSCCQLLNHCEKNVEFGISRVSILSNIKIVWISILSYLLICVEKEKSKFECKKYFLESPRDNWEYANEIFLGSTKVSIVK